MNWKLINVGLIWAAMTSTVTAVLWMQANFASAAEVNELKLDIAYGQFYDRLDDYEEALEEGREELAAEYRRRMERLRATICEQDPEWERCDDREE
jgi:hypothetical protein